MRLKLMTLNLHCLVEDNLEHKQKLISEKISSLEIDIVLLQEVAQTRSKGFIVEDNYGLTLQTLLEELGIKYYYYFEPIKESFGKYDEGVAILSRVPLKHVKSCFLSKSTDYSNWKTRKLLVYEFDSEKTIFLATTHFGWTDEIEVFEDQFGIANELLIKEQFAILAGDFNVTPNSKEYNHIKEKGWNDLFDNEDYRDFPTFKSDDANSITEQRIDYILTNFLPVIIKQEILFTEEMVSDHYGVFCEIEI